MKICKSCKRCLDYSFFHKQKRSKDGCQSYCKECIKGKNRDYNKTEEGRKKQQERFRVWSKKNKERIKEYHKKYYQENKKEYLKRDKINRQKPQYKKWKAEHARAQRQKYYKKHSAQEVGKILIIKLYFPCNKHIKNMRKLYIIEYDHGSASWYWAQDEQGARAEAIQADEATNDELDRAEIWVIDEAICKNDLIAALDRYIIKPLKRK
jgi:hypothetical protein